MNARRLVVHILKRYEDYSAGLERIVDEELSRAQLDRRDKGFVFEIAYGIVRRKLTLDHLVDRLVSAQQLRKNATLRRILQLGLYQILFMDRVPDHAAVNESVKLAKAAPETCQLTGVVNGILRRVIAERTTLLAPDLSATLEDRLSREYSHPRWMVERWLANFGLASAKRLLSFNNEKPDTYLRRKLRDPPRQQFETEVRTLCDSATGYFNLYYRLKKSVVPQNLRVIERGLCNVQSPSSGWVVALMDVRKGEKILDLCSSPGGKSALISELVGESGAVCAADSRWSRIMLTVDTVGRLGCSNVYPLVCDGRFLPFEGSFDQVLIDAPCSSTGVLHRHPDARWTRRPSDIEELAVLQRSLLESAASLVGPGAGITYATCSLEPEENELQVERFLKDHAEFERVPCPDVIPQSFVDNNGYLRITPFAHALDGMFGAKLRRKK